MFIVAQHVNIGGNDTDVKKFAHHQPPTQYKESVCLSTRGMYPALKEVSKALVRKNDPPWFPLPPSSG